jgi:hypothetical protein
MWVRHPLPRQEALRINRRQGAEFHLLGRSLGVKCCLIQLDDEKGVKMRPIKPRSTCERWYFQFFDIFPGFLASLRKGICTLATSP